MGRISASWVSGGGGEMFDKKALVQGIKRSLFLSVIGIGFLGMGVLISAAELFYFADIAFILFLASVLLGGLKAGTVAGKNGWLHGITIALIYSVVLVFLGSLIIPPAYLLGFMLLLVVTLSITGLIGGIIGVNLKGYDLRRQAKKSRLKEKYWTYH